MKARTAHIRAGQQPYQQLMFCNCYLFKLLFYKGEALVKTPASRACEPGDLQTSHRIVRIELGLQKKLTTRSNDLSKIGKSDEKDDNDSLLINNNSL